jgi:hypothetical protein
MEKFYHRPALPEKDRFRARRIQNWFLNPDSDTELTAAIKAGKCPTVEIFLDEVKEH